MEGRLGRRLCIGNHLILLLAVEIARAVIKVDAYHENSASAPRPEDDKQTHDGEEGRGRVDAGESVLCLVFDSTSSLQVALRLSLRL